MTENREHKIDVPFDEAIVILHISGGKVISQSDSHIEPKIVGVAVYKHLSDLMTWITLGTLRRKK